MSTTTISPKFQVVIPKEVREKLRLKSGQKMTVVTKGGMVYLIPERPFGSFKGFIKKRLSAAGLREDEDR